MNREEVTLLGFEIVAYAGDARSKLLEALKAAEAGDFAKADALVEEANSCWGGLGLQCDHDARPRPSNDYHLAQRHDAPFD